MPWYVKSLKVNGINISGDAYMIRVRGNYGSFFFAIVPVILAAVGIFLYVERVTQTGLLFHPSTFTYLRWGFLMSAIAAQNFVNLLAEADPQRRRYLILPTSLVILITLALWMPIEVKLAFTYGWAALPDPAQFLALFALLASSAARLTKKERNESKKV